MSELKLTDLEPAFMRYFEDTNEQVYFQEVPTRAEAHGIRFLCPLCFTRNKGAAGTHAIICWSRSAGTPEDARPAPGRWKMQGDSFETLSLVADPPATASSVMLLGGCKWHGHITNGKAVGGY